MKRLHILLVLLVASQVAFAQSYTYKQYVEAAERAMLNKDYQSALNFYSDAVKFGKDDLDVKFKTAEAARMYNAYCSAAEHYQSVLDNDSNGEYPLASFWLGDVKQRSGDYPGAITSYDMYLSEHEGEDEYYTQKARKEKLASEWSQGIIASPDQNITVEHLGDGVNSPFSDIAPVYDGENLIFSSLRFDQENTELLPVRQYSKVLTLNGTDAVDYDENLNGNDVITAHSAFNINKSRLYYTVCEYENVTDIRCELYYRPVLGDGSLGNAVRLPDEVNASGATNTQPAIGFNESLGKEVLYFVSNRNGGKGGLDIYTTTLEAGDTFGAVSNLSSINTAGDDLTPFYHNASQVLYFSSDGYQRLGGIDIYRSAVDDGALGQPEHMGAPINSSYDDLYYSLDEEGGMGHFSSNRNGSQFLDVSDENSCASCYDIYKADISDNIQLDLNALTFDISTNEALLGATVRLIDIATGEEVGLITNLDGNDHQFQLMRGKEYKIIVEHEDYLPAEAIYSTTVTLENLTDNSVQTITLTGSGSSNEFMFNVIKGHSYRLSGSKSGYYNTSISFVASYAEGQYLLIKRLYLQPSIPELYLPLVLYFDNDIPDLRSRLTTTNKTYSLTYNNYIVRKEEFKSKYSAELDEPLASEARAAVEAFFEDKFRSGRYRNGVREGYNRFQLFLNTVLNELSSGREYKMSIRGFASPRAATKYNAALSQRRVESIKNEIRQYAGGALVPYLNSGKLVIEELAYGETTSDASISDRLYDLRNSIFSPEASQERRVEIERIISQ